MKKFIKIFSRCFSRLTKTNKTASTSPPRPATPTTNPTTVPTVVGNALDPRPHHLSQPQSSAPTPLTPALIKAYETEYPLFSLNRLGVDHSHRDWFRRVNIAVRKHMNTLDASHNYQHIRRVVSNAAYILEEEKKQHQWARDIDPIILWVTCMTHDIGDTKYQADGEQLSQHDQIVQFLSVLDCPSYIRRQVAYLAPRVSFKKEMANEADTKAFADVYQVLRIVQDADRLDGLGAIGVSRLFIYGGVDEVRRNGSIDSGIKLIEARFGEYARLMKTETGRKIAEERYGWMKEDFVRRWEAEADTSNV
ncbi:hypothetical protein ACET3X_006322 [Alternaria dauci]|uniref:HD/PDEase domain-containing protein n=1 Tax=Alternaria dauci TaxID=48095 RepID=A0ABR3UHZ6_9PLEO